MKSRNIEAAHSDSGTDTQTILTDRTQQLNQLFISNYQLFTETAYQTYPALLVWDCDKIISSLSRNLNRYGGPPEQAPFLKWATRFARKEAQRYKITADILSEHSQLIRAAIHKCLWTTAVNASVEHQDIFSEIAFLIFERAHSLARKDKAKLTTRLWALVDKHIYLYHNSYNARQLELVRQYPTSIDCDEQLSGTELEAYLAEKKSESGYDPGYAEISLSEM